MDLSVLPSKLFSRLSSAAEIVRRHDFIQVYSHYDADGISSAGIIAKTLLREGIDFRVTLFNTLNEEQMEIIRNTDAKCIIISDLGASYIEKLEEMDCDIIVLDHHTLSVDSEKVVYANPHLVGIDGMTSGCGATMSFLFSISVSEKNWDLVQIAFAGMAGDRQTIKGISGLNEFLLEGGIKKGFIEEMDGSFIPLGNLMSELYLCTDPYIRGVSGSTEGVATLLKDANIDNVQSYRDLDAEALRKLSSLVALKLVSQGVTSDTMEELVRKRYYLTDWNMDAEMLASLLDGCGRQNEGGVGVSLLLGDGRSMNRASELNKEYRTRKIDGVLVLEESGLTQMDHIQFFDSSSTGMTGVMCGIAMQYIGKAEKPTIGLNCTDTAAHISSRGNWKQLNNGIDLAMAMKEACKATGGEGGGHRIAAGGSVPVDRNRDFLVKLDEIIEQQLNSAK